MTDDIEPEHIPPTTPGNSESHSDLPTPASRYRPRDAGPLFPEPIGAMATRLTFGPRGGGRPPGSRQHAPRRPLWLCLVCAQPWPCGEARVRLTREYAEDRTTLRIFLATRMNEAIADLLTLNPQDAPTAEEFFSRFLAWIPPRPKHPGR